MDNTTYEETRLKKDESWSKYLKEGAEVALLIWNGKVISVDSPPSVELEVVDTDPGLKGNTAAGGALFPWPLMATLYLSYLHHHCSQHFAGAKVRQDIPLPAFWLPSSVHSLGSCLQRTGYSWIPEMHQGKQCRLNKA